MADHAPYIHAVADHLDKAGFFTLSVRWEPQGGHIELGCQDGWDHYDRGDADVLWDVRDGWRIRWGGLTDDLCVPMLAPPWVVALAVGDHVGQAAQIGDVDGTYQGQITKPGTPEFDAALAAYDTERTPR